MMRSMLCAIALGLLAGFVVACLSGCGKRPVGSSESPVMSVSHTAPDEFGVVCYSLYPSSAPLSCVQVQESRK